MANMVSLGGNELTTLVTVFLLHLPLEVKNAHEYSAEYTVIKKF